MSFCIVGARSGIRLVLYLIISLILLCLSVAGFATQTETRGLHAAPAPGAVIIDGSLKDWDLSGQTLMCYDLENLRDIYSAQVSLMYDETNLYMAIHFKAPRPLSNHHDPRYNGNKGWAADSVQIRFKTDRIAHVTAWDFVDKSEPAINISYGDDGGDPSITLFQTKGWEMERGAAMAFQKDIDNKGYVQEIRLPWNIIANRKFAPGESLNMGFELLWGGGDWPDMRYADNLMPGKSSREFFWTAKDSWGPVTLEKKGNFKLPPPDWAARIAKSRQEQKGPVSIAYILPKDARVTIAVDDDKGTRVRNLIAALPRVKGKNTELWDGLDDYGKPVAPGKYSFKGIYHDPIHTNWVMSFASPGNPSWDTADGRGGFYGDHSAPRAVAAAGEFVALGCPIGEAGKPLIACDLNGQRIWGQANRNFGQFGIQSLATDGTTLWVGSDAQPPVIYRVQMATGLYSPWNKTVKDPDGHDIKILDLPVTTTIEEDKRPKDPNDVTLVATVGPNLTAIAYRSGRIAVSLEHDNQIKILDSDTGEIKATYSVNAPKSVIFDLQGDLLAISEGKIIRIKSDGIMSPFSNETWNDAIGLTIDNAGNVYLSVRGIEQNVKRYSSEGKLIAEIGKRGGRPSHGKYDETAMLNPAQIAIDSKGRLWIAEENFNPKRTSIWDTKSGALIKELVGTTPYAGAGGINPFDPTMAFSTDTVFKLDLEKGTSKPVYSISASRNSEQLFPPSVFSITHRIIQHSAVTLVYTSDGAWQYVTITAKIGDDWKSVAALGLVLNHDELMRNQYAPESIRKKFAHPIWKGHEGELFTWTDKNGDGLVQLDELKFSVLIIKGVRAKLENHYWGQLPDTDGTISYFNTEANALVKFAVSAWTDNGMPVYDPTNVQVLKADIPGIIHNDEGHIAGGADGVVYKLQNPMFAMDKTGHVIFTYPNNNPSVHGSHTAKSSAPGYLIGPSSILGVGEYGPEIGEIFDTNGNLGENYLFTRDGLWVQSLFKDVRGGYTVSDKAARGISLDEITAGSESFGGNFVRTTAGKTYLTIGGTDARVIELTGLESIKRFNGKFEYSPKQFLAAQKLMQEKAAKASESRNYRVAMLAKSLDGSATSWPELTDYKLPAMDIEDSADARFARVSAKWDKDNLYIAWRVFSPVNRMRNSGQDHRLLFKTGDVVDLMLGPDPQSSLGKDLRLLMTIKEGTPIAVINRKTAPGAPASDKYVFSTNWHVLEFEQVKAVKEVQIVSSPIQDGYFVQAVIPWKMLGFIPRSGLKFRADAGALMADQGGVNTIARHYWSNKATALVSDIPGEAELTPALWGNWTLE